MENSHEQIKNKIAENLAISGDKKVRSYLATRAPIELVIKMASIEEDNDIIVDIIKVLNEQKEEKIIKDSCLSLLKAANWKTRQFALRKISFNEDNIKELIDMALVETDHTVAKEIAEILTKNIHLSLVSKRYSELSNAKSIYIQEFVVYNAPIEIISDMSEHQLDYEVARCIIDRLYSKRKQ